MAKKTTKTKKPVKVEANPPKCPLGYTWDAVLKTCVFDG
jgi:hypothetical protein